MIRIENVTRHYSDGTRPALDDVSLEFKQGEFVFVTGPSGAGKSTLLKLLYAAEFPDQGDVLIHGKSVVRLHPSSIPYLRRNIGVIFQDFKLLSRRSVFDNIALARAEYAGPLIVNDSFKLPEAKQAVETGLASAVSFARAFIGNPDLVARFEQAAELNKFDPKRLYTPGPEGYTDYPTLD